MTGKDLAEKFQESLESRGVQAHKSGRAAILEVEGRRIGFVVARPTMKRFHVRGRDYEYPAVRYNLHVHGSPKLADLWVLGIEENGKVHLVVSPGNTERKSRNRCLVLGKRWRERWSPTVSVEEATERILSELRDDSGDQIQEEEEWETGPWN